MLLSTYEMLKRIKVGIKQESFVYASFHELGLEIRAEVVPTKNKQRYYITRIFSKEEMTDMDAETAVIDHFIDHANRQFNYAANPNDRINRVA